MGARAKPARPRRSASQANALDGRTSKARAPSTVGVASERLGRAHEQSPRALDGRRRKRTPWTGARAKPARPLRSASQANALDGRTSKARTPSTVGVASERLGRAHEQSPHALYGR